MGDHHKNSRRDDPTDLRAFSDVFGLKKKKTFTCHIFIYEAILANFFFFVLFILMRYKSIKYQKCISG